MKTLSAAMLGIGLLTAALAAPAHAQPAPGYYGHPPPPPLRHHRRRHYHRPPPPYRGRELPPR